MLRRLNSTQAGQQKRRDDRLRVQPPREGSAFPGASPLTESEHVLHFKSPKVDESSKLCIDSQENQLESGPTVPETQVSSPVGRKAPINPLARLLKEH